MAMYTTGELAKLCGVSVRTVQYYDSRNILVPSELSEGGRRLYTEQDIKRMKIICFLRDAGISINNIRELLSREDPGSVISILLEQQEKLLQEEVNERQAKNEASSRCHADYGYSSQHFSMDCNYPLDYRRHVAALCHLYPGCRTFCAMVIPSLLQAGNLYLPSVSSGLSPCS